MARLAGNEFRTGHYTHSQLEELWVAAGGVPSSKNLMAAIAEAESSGNSWVVNSIGATGLWQIHPGGNEYLNPMKNAEEAVYKLKTQGLTAWTTYTSGAYAKYLAPGGNINIPGEPVITRGGPEGYVPHGTEGLEGSILSTLTPEPEVKSLFEKYGGWTKELQSIFAFLLSKEGWIRILEILAGGALLLIAVKELFHVEPPTPVPVPV